MLFKFLKAESWKDLIIHFLLASVLIVLFILSVFYVFLPIKTNHGESISVPDVVGMNIEELSDFLDSKRLRYVVTQDSGYNADMEPHTVLIQFPKPNTSVKEDRKIYVTLNSKKAPLVKFPDFPESRSFKNVELQFSALGLKVGKKEYKLDHLKHNVVGDFLLDGKKVAAGDYLPKGSKIDLLLGTGKGKQSFKIPDVIGQDFESAEIALRGAGLEIGEISYQEVDSLPGLVVDQIPASPNIVKVGQLVNLTVSTLDSLESVNSSLNNND